MDNPFTPDMFERLDDSNDALFYTSPSRGCITRDANRALV
jgi:hypothetical protein